MFYELIERLNNYKTFCLDLLSGFLKRFSFFIRRFHSFIALIPLTVFLFFHFALNSSVFFNGNESYVKVIEFMQHIPGIIFIEIFVLAFPILFHAIYGMWIVYVAKNNIRKFVYYRNFAFYLQRLTAVITLAFVFWHVYILKFTVHEAQPVIDTIVALLNNRLIFALYVISVVSAIYHCMNGIFTALITWGITVGERVQKIVSFFTFGGFAVVSIWAIAILIKISNLG